MLCRFLSVFVGFFEDFRTYNQSVGFPSFPVNGKGGDDRMGEILLAFIISVMAGIVAYYICKWLDGD